LLAALVSHELFGFSKELFCPDDCLRRREYARITKATRRPRFAVASSSPTPQQDAKDPTTS
jgi:hypothetical protein